MSHLKRFSKHSDKHRVDESWECPSGKWGFSTKAITIQSIADLVKSGRTMGKALHPYKCPYCKCWHMTSQER